MKNQKWIVLLVMLTMSSVAFSQVGLVNCNPPEQAAILSTSFDSATLSWTPGEETNDWIIEVGLPGFKPGSNTHTNLYDFSVLKYLPRVNKRLMDLESNKRYDVYIKSNCSGSGTSQWIGPVRFKTQRLTHAGDI